MVTVKLPRHHSLDCVIRTPDLYLVPRGDGRVVIGASVERAGYGQVRRQNHHSNVARRSRSALAADPRSANRRNMGWIAPLLF